MAVQKLLHAKENRRRWLRPAGDRIDYLFLVILLVLLGLGLTMLYSASSAQSQYDTGYTDSTRYLRSRRYVPS